MRVYDGRIGEKSSDELKMKYAIGETVYRVFCKCGGVLREWWEV